MTMKKEWTAPALEVLDVHMTEAGKGTTLTDWVTPDDKDIYDS
jgi:hypothetical protein